VRPWNKPTFMAHQVGFGPTTNWLTIKNQGNFYRDGLPYGHDIEPPISATTTQRLISKFYT